MRILGIDPGYGILGWSVIEDNLKLVNYGTIRTEKELPFDERLLIIHKELNTIISEFKPDNAAIEKIFFQKNTKTAIDVAKVIGVVALTLKLSEISYAEYTPNQIKLAITGYGKADKAQVQEMIKRLLNIKEVPKPDDAADALAIAICHSCKNRI